ncbi:MAG: hypothetical protein IT379_07720 [Deltaproteobacteria bacterium]|nr:hypothetical protein [Deltaproteobacteria bacterium]
MRNASPLGVVLVIGISACGTDSRSHSDPAGADAATGTDVGSETDAALDATDAYAPAVLGSIVVRVVTVNPYVYLAMPQLPVSARAVSVAAHGMPAAGAIVTLDLANGERVERVSDAMGIARFDDLDESLGPATVTAWVADAMAFATQIGVTPGGDDVVLYVAELLTEDTVNTVFEATIEGVVTGTADRSDELVIPGREPPPSSLAIFGPDGVVGSGSVEDDAYRYEASFRRNEATTMIAVEHVMRAPPPSDRLHQDVLGWSTFDVGPFASERERLDLDLASRVVVPDRLTLAYPVDDAMSWVDFDVAVRTRRGQLSVMTRLRDLADTSRVEVELELLRLRPDADVFTQVQQRGRTVRVPGYPVAGGSAIDWPRRATLVSPPEASPGAPLPIHPADAPIRWTYDDVPPTALVLSVSYATWTLTFPEGATEITLPAPPAGFDLAAFFQTFLASPQPPSATLLHCEPGSGVLENFCARAVASRVFEVEL